MSSYLWHRVSESEKVKIEQDAKDLILEFGDALERLPKLPESAVERKSDRRIEGNGKNSDQEFRELMLQNAPETKDGFIVAEKGKWEDKNDS